MKMLKIEGEFKDLRGNDLDELFKEFLKRLIAEIRKRTGEEFVDGRVRIVNDELKPDDYGVSFEPGPTPASVVYEEWPVGLFNRFYLVLKNKEGKERYFKVVLTGDAEWEWDEEEKDIFPVGELTIERYECVEIEEKPEPNYKYPSYEMEL